MRQTVPALLACASLAADVLPDASPHCPEKSDEPEPAIFARAAVWASNLIPEACDTRVGDGCDWLSIAVSWRYAWNNLRLTVELADRMHVKYPGENVQSQLGRIHDLIDTLGEDPGLWYANWHQAGNTARQLVRLISSWLIPKGKNPGCELKPALTAMSSSWHHGLRFPQQGRSLQVDASSRFALGKGVEMPVLGLALRPTEEDVYEASCWALSLGIRLLFLQELTPDSFRQVLRAVWSSGVPRQEVFLAGKILHGGLVKHIRAVLAAEQLDALALRPGEAGLDLEAWQEMQELVTTGLVHAIGISDLSPEKGRVASLQQLSFVQGSFTIYEPGGADEGRRWNSQMEQLSALGVPTVGVSFGRNGGCGYLQPSKDPHVAAVAQRVGRTTMQVIHRWFLQLGGVVLLESKGGRQQLQEDADVFRFALSEVEMRRLNGLSTLTASSPGRRAPVWCEDVYRLSELPLD